MKRLILSLFLFGISTYIVQAQQTVQNEINSRYVNNQHQQYLYLVNPQLRQLDNQLMNEYQQFQELLIDQPEVLVDVIGDTSWSYAESKSFLDSVYTPGTYTHYVRVL